MSESTLRAALQEAECALSLMQSYGHLEESCGEGLDAAQARAIKALRQVKAALAAAPQAAPSVQVAAHPWPFVESPGYFAGRLAGAHAEFHGDMLAAVRNVLIENPPTLASSPQASPPQPEAKPVDERPAFEAWALSEEGGWWPEALERIGDCYRAGAVTKQWVGWQARAALTAATAGGGGPK